MSGQQTTPLPDPAGYVEGLALAARCPRHRPHMRACAYDAGKPCHCREMMELIYASNPETTPGCPDCGGRGTIAAFVDREDGGHFDLALRCTRCKGVGTISAQETEWITRGRVCMEQRRQRDISIMEAARALGLRPSEVSAMERGRADPWQLEREWA